ncbi:hypothetical protein AB0K48_56180, partial [Nonomuraea sp. NPDC055795]
MGEQTPAERTGRPEVDGLLDAADAEHQTLNDLVVILHAFLSEGTRLHHPAYLAHQVASPDFPAALA